jgi:dTDP-4-amino-4,6-dideoxygalactose transaminase
MIPFNSPFVVGNEYEYIREAVAARHLSGNGAFTKRCHAWLERDIGCARALLTHSCTAALEMSALLLELQPGDEVIMPSFAFVSTANAFVLRGAVPVFVDIRADTQNIDERLIEAAVTPRTRAVVALHYAGVACEMTPILDIAGRHNLAIVEDAAQGIRASYRGRPLGSIGALGALSFHETKNVISGEGGALLVNDARFAERAEILWEKGTNRSQFFRGQVDKYTWMDVGSSFLPSELNAAFLQAQLEAAERTTAARQAIWDQYYGAFADLEAAGYVRRPIVPAHCGHNAHIFYLLARDLDARTELLRHLRDQGVDAVFHYVPLHSSPAGQRYGRAAGDLRVTTATSDRLVRLPLWAGMSDEQVHTIIDAVRSAVASLTR